MQKEPVGEIKVIKKMAAKDDKIPTFGKLEGDGNWPMWKIQMQDYFEAVELWGIITGDEVEPDAPAALAADANQAARREHQEALDRVRKYRVNCARIKNILNQTVTESVAHIMLRADLVTPKQRWDALVENFDRPSLSNKLQLLQRLLNLKLEAGTSVDKYFREFQDVSQRLASLRVDLGADMSIAVLLNGLPQEYEALRTSFMAKGEVSIAELHEALRTEENRRNGQGNGGNGGDTVLRTEVSRYGP